MILTGNDDLVGAWVCERVGKLWYPGAGRTLGWLNEKGGLVAGVCFIAYDGLNVWLDCAAEPKNRWLDRRGLFCIFDYAFRQLGCVRVSAMVPDGNDQSIRLLSGVGFEYEAQLARAAPDGKAMLIFRLFKEDCKWLKR